MSAGDDLSGETVEFTAPEGKSQAQIMDELLDVCLKIEMMQAQFDASRPKTKLGKVVEDANKPQGKVLHNYLDAVALQKYKTQRKALMDCLEKPKLASAHPFPDTLEPFFKRNRNEIREFMGLEPLEGGDEEFL